MSSVLLRDLLPGFDSLPFPAVEPRGLEPRTLCLQSRCATNCAMAPYPAAPTAGVGYLLGLMCAEPGNSLTVRGGQGSNLRPAVLETAALPAELPPPGCRITRQGGGGLGVLAGPAKETASGLDLPEAVPGERSCRQEFRGRFGALWPSPGWRRAGPWCERGRPECWAWLMRA